MAGRARAALTGGGLPSRTELRGTPGYMAPEIIRAGLYEHRASNCTQEFIKTGGPSMQDEQSSTNSPSESQKTGMGNGAEIITLSASKP